MYDAIIIGSGPSGLMAGLAATRCGKDFLIIDKKKEIGKPVQCAEGIIDLVLKMFDLPILPEYNVTEFGEMYLPNGKKGSLNMVTIKTIVLDRTLFEKDLAKRVDCEIKLNERVLDYKDGIVITDKGEYEGKWIIDASGYRSIIGCKVGLNYPLEKNDYFKCLQYTIRHPDIDDKTIKVHLNLGNLGYTWEFPKGDHVSNIGLGAVSGRIKNILLDHLDKYYPGYEIVRRSGGICPIPKPLDRVTNGNVMVVGDAARLVLAQSGAGLPNSLKSGYLGGLCDPGKYENFYRKYLYPELWKNWVNKEKGLRYNKFNLITWKERIAYRMYNVLPNSFKYAVEKRIAKGPKYQFFEYI